MTKFPIIKLHGSPSEVGLEHGRILKSKIEEALTYYLKLFDKKDSELQARGSHFKNQILKFNPKYCTEINAIARGAGLDEYLIYALNARSELLNNYANECSVIYDRKNGLLSENWDWASIFENLAVILKMNLQNSSIMTITEPGIIGKIGFNNYGIGVALNYLGVDSNVFGVPIHVALRSALESSSVESFMRNIFPKINDTAGHLLIAEKNKAFHSLEFAGSRVFEVTNENDYYVHTNHYLGDPTLNTPIDEFEGSLLRFDQVHQLINSSPSMSLEAAKNILKSQLHNEFPVCRQYTPHEQIEDIGTVCSVIFDLVNLKMDITRGNPFDHPYEVIPLL